MSRVVRATAICIIVVAAGPAAADEPCEIRVGAVVASNSGRLWDERLDPLRRQFVSLFQYTSYRLLKDESRSVQWGSRAGFDLPGGRYLLIIPRERRNDKVAFKLMVIDGARALVDTQMALKNHGTVLVGGPPHKEGVLIIAIRVHTDDG